MTEVIEMTPMLPVSAIEKSIAFYTGTLGFEIDYSQPHIALLRKGAASLYLVLHSPPTTDKPNLTIAKTVTEDQTPINLTFRVRDVTAVWQELADKGVAFLAPPEEKPWGEIRVFTRDPDGYLLEFYQPL